MEAINIKSYAVQSINELKENMLKLSQLYCSYSGNGWVISNGTYTFVLQEHGIKNTHIACKTFNPFVFKREDIAENMCKEYSNYYVNGANESIELEVNSLKEWYLDEMRELKNVIELIEKSLTIYSENEPIK